VCKSRGMRQARYVKKQGEEKYMQVFGVET
jgi:hypothetical protein